MSLGSYLRAARENRQLTLDELAAIIKIKRTLLADLERDDVSRWPTQRVYRHGYLRAYAVAVSLEPSHVLARFDDEFGDQHPVAFHGPPKKPAKPAPLGFARTAALLAGLVILIVVTVRLSDPVDHAMAVTHDDTPVAADTSPEMEPLMQPTAGTATADDPIERDTADPVNVEGELRITSQPPGAHVTINGIGRGLTPVRVRYLPVGTYTVRVIHPDYRIVQRQITLKPEQPARTVRVVLRDANPTSNPSSDTVGDHAAGRVLRESSWRGDASGPSH